MGLWPADRKFMAQDGGQGVVWKQAGQFLNFALTFYFIFLYYTLHNIGVLVNKVKFNKWISVPNNCCSYSSPFTHSFVSFKCGFGVAQTTRVWHRAHYSRIKNIALTIILIKSPSITRALESVLQFPERTQKPERKRTILLGPHYFFPKPVQHSTRRNSCYPHNMASLWTPVQGPVELSICRHIGKPTNLQSPAPISTCRVSCSAKWGKALGTTVGKTWLTLLTSSSKMQAPARGCRIMMDSWDMPQTEEQKESLLAHAKTKQSETYQLPDRKFKTITVRRPAIFKKTELKLKHIRKTRSKWS